MRGHPPACAAAGRVLGPRWLSPFSPRSRCTHRARRAAAGSAAALAARVRAAPPGSAPAPCPPAGLRVRAAAALAPRQGQGQGQGRPPPGSKRRGTKRRCRQPCASWSRPGPARFQTRGSSGKSRARRSGLPGEAPRVQAGIPPTCKPWALGFTCPQPRWPLLLSKAAPAPTLSPAAASGAPFNLPHPVFWSVRAVQSTTYVGAKGSASPRRRLISHFSS